MGEDVPMAVECPRCGYDQGGVVASWREACPLAGVCSECGYGFAWADLMREDRRHVPGFVEDASGVWGRKGVIACAWRTWAWAVVPWVFWQKVRLEARLRPQRIAAWFAVVILSLHALASGLSLARMLVLKTKAPPPPTYTWLWAPAAGAPATPPPGVTPPSMSPTRNAFVPAVTLPNRSTAYWVAAPSSGAGYYFHIGAAVLLSSLTEPLVRLYDHLSNGDWHPWLMAVVEDRYGAAGAGGGGWGADVGGEGKYWPDGVLSALLIHSGMCGLVLLLPSTRRLARVRTAHVFRAMVYGLAWVAPFALIRIGNQAYALWVAAHTPASGLTGFMPSAARALWPRQMTFSQEFSAAVGAGVLMYVSVWWLTAFVRGWKFQHGWLVWAVLMVPAGLMGWAAHLIVAPV